MGNGGSRVFWKGEWNESSGASCHSDCWHHSVWRYEPRGRRETVMRAGRNPAPQQISKSSFKLEVLHLQTQIDKVSIFLLSDQGLGELSFSIDLKNLKDKGEELSARVFYHNHVMMILV